MKRIHGLCWGFALWLVAQAATAQTPPRLGLIEQTASQSPAPNSILSMAMPLTAGAADANACGSSCRQHGHGCCNVVWLKPWTCKDLEMESVERKPHCHNCCGLLHGLLYCPAEPEESKDDEKKNGNGNGKDEKKNGKDEKKNGNGKDEKKNGNGKEEEKEEEAPDLNPLMQQLKCSAPYLFSKMEHCDTKIYGWLQGGATFNPASPRDRLNFGTNFNNRSNDVMLNQLYLVLEKPIDLDKKKHEFQFAYRFDLVYGHDVPYFSNYAYGWSNNQTAASGQSPRTTDNGVDLLQAYAEMHLPILTDRGVDFRVGRFYTYLSAELTQAPSAPFYSHNYEYFYGPFTHTGFSATVHLGDTVDTSHALIRGWEPVFQDINDAWGYMGNLVWNSCDKRSNLTLAWVFSPEQSNDNHNWRRHFSGYYTQKFGDKNQWTYTGGGSVGWETGGDPLNPGARPAEWYCINNYLFYTVDPRLTLGVRAEWYHDDDGNRSGIFNDQFINGNRPGYAGSFYDLTFGATWKPFQNLRVRPEIRFDWFDGPASFGSLPFNDQRDRFQTTLGFDVVWEF